MLIQEKPCKVTSVLLSAPSKRETNICCCSRHLFARLDGHSKCHFFAVDIFTNKKYEDIMPSSHNAYIPNLVKTDYQLINISSDGFCSLLHEDGSVREDIALPTIPDSLGRDICSDFEEGKSLVVTVFSAMGHTQIVASKEDPKQLD
jgi:translation initiation factor 5A